MTDSATHRPHLSKGRYVSGWQCWNKLWWEVHEPDADELRVGPALQDLIDQGNQVGAAARELFPGGVHIDLPHDAVPERVAATQAALDAGAPAIFEASFAIDAAYVAVDVLERVGEEFNLIEVKATNEVKGTHVVDVAVQLHVLRANGVPVRHAEVMHLNRAYRLGGPEPLLVREDITPHVLEHVGAVAEEIEAQFAVLAGDTPPLSFGDQCISIDSCPFQRRCWPQDKDHVLRLSGKGVRKALELMAHGIHRIQDLPADVELTPVNQRQKAAIEMDNMAVDASLPDRLAEIRSPVGFLDFETVGRAVPAWEGLAPWGAVPVQFSYHEEADDGTYRRVEWLAEGPDDPRPLLAEALIAACRNAACILTYTTFERVQIRALIGALPHLETELRDIDTRLLDLHRVVKSTIYHPDFYGSFSIKDVLPVLVPDLDYSDLAIQDGRDASALLAKLMLRGDEYSPEQRTEVRRQLLEYCGLDTWAMVRLLEALRAIAGVVR